MMRGFVSGFALGNVFGGIGFAAWASWNERIGLAAIGFICAWLGAAILRQQLRQRAPLWEWNE